MFSFSPSASDLSAIWWDLDWERWSIGAVQQCTQERMSGKETGPLHIKYHLTPNLLHLLPLWWEEEDVTAPHAARNSPHLSPFGSRWWRKRSHVINTSRQKLSRASLCLRRKKWGQTFKQQRNEITKITSEATIQDPPARYLTLHCHNPASYQYITWLIWRADHRFAVGMRGSG